MSALAEIINIVYIYIYIYIYIIYIYTILYIYIYIDPQEKISTFKTFRHKPSSVIITDEGLCRNVLKVGIFS